MSQLSSVGGKVSQGFPVVPLDGLVRGLEPRRLAAERPVEDLPWELSHEGVDPPALRGGAPLGVRLGLVALARALPLARGGQQRDGLVERTRHGPWAQEQGAALSR